MNRRISTLDEFINESKQTIINEAFESNILRIMSKTKMWRQIKDSIKLKWDEIKDDDFIQLEPVEAAKKAKKQDGQHPMVIFWMNGNDLLGVSRNDWVMVTEFYYKSYRSGATPVYRSVDAIKRDSTNTYIIDDARYIEFNANDVRQERWANKQDAEAFKQNYEIKNANITRYKGILAENKTKRLLPEEEEIKTMVKEVFEHYQTLFEKLVGSPDWYKIKKLGGKIANFLNLYSEFTNRSTQVADYKARGKEPDAYYNDELRKNYLGIKQILLELQKENEEQVAAA